MAKPQPNKRSLQFVDFGEMMADVEMLQKRGYVRNGNWTLGQACGHVADWMSFPLDGFPKPPLPMRVIFWLMKVTVAPGMKRKILAEGFQGGMPTAPETVPAADAITDRQGIEKLQHAVERVKSWRGELIPSPLFGKMDMSTHTKVSLLHAQHHFGYLEPRQES